MSEFATAKNPPVMRAGDTSLEQLPSPASSVLTAQQVTHATAAGATDLAAGGDNPLVTAAATVAAAAQNQQAQQAPVVSASSGTGLAGTTLTQSTLQQGAMLQQQDYPTPLLLDETTQYKAAAGAVQQHSAQQQHLASQQPQFRFFTGTVTKLQENLGFIDDYVFFQMSVVKGSSIPKAGDTVRVEATYNPNMPYKWSATRVQVVGIDENQPSNY